MNKQDKAKVQQVLEFLEIISPKFPPLVYTETDRKRDEAITALRQLLEAQPAVPLTPRQICEMGLKYGMTNLERFFYELGISDAEAAHGITTSPIVATPLAQPDDQPDYEFHYRQLLEKYETLQAASKPADWVGLTDEDVMAEAAQEEQAHGFIQGVRWADAKLREKNGY